MINNAESKYILIECNGGRETRVGQMDCYCHIVQIILCSSLCGMEL